MYLASGSKRDEHETTPGSVVGEPRQLRTFAQLQALVLLDTFRVDGDTCVRVGSAGRVGRLYSIPGFRAHRSSALTQSVGQPSGSNSIDPAPLTMLGTSDER